LILCIGATSGRKKNSLIAGIQPQKTGKLAIYCICSQYTPMIDSAKITGFDWNDGSARKNDKHSVSIAESEQVFFNEPLLLIADVKNSQGDIRFHALGKSDEGRVLHITVTLRNAGEKIRVISARDMNRKERIIYEQTT
jgi:uncharacterized DUF497 family protein